MKDEQAVVNVERGYIKGEVLHVVFRNEENYYTVALVLIRSTNEEIKERKMAVVGTLPQLEPGEIFLFYGYESEHPRFGSQYHVQEFKRELRRRSKELSNIYRVIAFPESVSERQRRLWRRLGNGR